MNYTVRLESRAEKELLALPDQVLRRVDARLRALTKDPQPRGALKLKGKTADGWRLRVGEYRILYTVERDQRVVRVFRIRRRREAYRNLP